MSSDESSILDFGDDSGSSFDEQPVQKAPPKKTTTTKKAPAKKAAPKKRAIDLDDDASDDGNLEATPPVAKKQKKAPAAKAGKPARKPAGKAAGKPLKPKTNEMDLDSDDGGDNGGMNIDSEVIPRPEAKQKTSSETYQKLSQLEHILKRPDTYVGSVEPTQMQMWVYDSEASNMNLRTITMIPGLYKIFDEILVNAADNKVRDPSMDTVKVTFSRENNEISILNNGRGIPITVHEKEGIYIPELIFGHLLTSSNYDDDEKKVTGGRNGYGAKLCNIFSTEFMVETADKTTKKKYRQTWTGNMSKVGKPKITANSKDEYTKITFKPDLSKFGLTEMDADLEGIVKRRVYDMAGTVKDVKVYLNGERIAKVKNFKQYCEMHVKALREESGQAGEKLELLHTKVNDRWEVAFAVSNGTFQQVSFVNNIATTSGGTHVNHVADQISAKLVEVVKKKNKSGASLKPAQMRNHFFLFVNCQIENPAFTSQTKEQLTTKPSAFGSKCPIPEEFMKKILKTEVVSNIIDYANFRADKAQKKTDGSRRSRIHNAQLTDANLAGTKDGHKCTLILTEGLSAQMLAIAGISAINGRDHYGVFPLRGKVLNVRDASHDQIMKNQEIQNIKQILGLQHKKHYDSTKDLRYGHIMIMTDQDHDGSHIKGLLINFFETQYPSLLRIPNFLVEFITPIVRVFKGPHKKPTKEVAFFTMPEYEYWKENNKEPGWRQKYYKGLGTSDNEDAKVYFADLDKHMKFFHTMDDEGKRLVELAFSKTKADERKEWLREYKPGTYLDHGIDMIPYPEFINKELILFSIADCARSIPSIVDGLKPGQRKIMYGTFKRNLKGELKVAQLSGYVSEHTAYHHGEQSLQGTITNMGQTFVGSNNVNLLDPSGNFGSRLQGGKDAASARYIYTSLSPFTRKVLPVEDDRLLTYNYEDGAKIEPEWYCPVIPMILVNGAEGIGTGWSTNVPSYNPEDIIANIRRLMKGGELEPMTPWFRGWTGTTERLSEHRFKFTGTIRQIDDLKLEVTELPIRMWTQTFKEKLLEYMKSDKGPTFVKDFVDYNSPTKVHFIITMESQKAMQEALAEGLENKFKLTTTLATTNLVAFDPQGRIMRYNTVEDIMKEFYYVRLKYYQLRKERLLEDLNTELVKLSNQARFIQMIIKKEVTVNGRKRADIISQLKRHNFAVFSKKKEAEIAGETEPTVDMDSEPDEDDATDVSDGYNYLLGMAIWTLTEEKANKLLQDVKKKEEEIDVLQKKTPKDLWNHDLEEFLLQWNHALEEDKRLEETVVKKRGNKLIKKRGKKATNDESDYESPVAKKRAPAKKQTTLSFKPAERAVKKEKEAPARAAAKKAPIIDELSDDDFAVIEATAPKPKMKPEPPQPKKPAERDFSDDDLDILANSKGKKATELPKDGGDSFITAEEEPTPKKPGVMDLVDDESDFDIPKPKKPSPKKRLKAPAQPKTKSKAPPKDELSIFDLDSDDDAPALKPTKARSQRAAAKKAPVVEADDDDFDDDSNGDILGSMVKGIGDESAASARPLFAASSSRKSSTTVPKVTAAKRTASKVTKGIDLPGDSEDETLAPASGHGMEIDEDSEDSLVPVATKKTMPAKKPVVTKKPTTKPAPKMTAKPAAKSTAKPAAKAAPKAKAKTIGSDDEMDVDAEVDRLLDSDEDDLPLAKAPTAKPKAKAESSAAATSRPARGARAAATKKAVYYEESDDSDEESDGNDDGSEDEFDDEDDD